MQDILIRDLGNIAYKEAWELQQKISGTLIAAKLKNRDATADMLTEYPNYLLFCEHPHVYTLGKSGSDLNLLLSNEELKKRGVSFFKINRGGDITYHGPGQLVAYPILDLEKFFTDLGLYLRNLEELIIRVLGEYGIKGDRLPGATGVWLEPENPFRARKICAMGIHCSRWVTMHGLALNINTDLTYFEGIIPCGLTDKKVTSMQKELGMEIPIPDVREKLIAHFGDIFQAHLKELSAEAIFPFS